MEIIELTPEETEKALPKRADIDTRIKLAAAELAERRKQAESNPLIYFPAQMLAAGGCLSITAPDIIVPKEKGYNICSRNGLCGILNVRDWIDDAYWLYLDILEDPMTAVEDEMAAANDDDFLFDCPKEMSPFGNEYRKWRIEQVVNRKPKASDSRRLRIATFIVSLLDYEDLYERPPDEIYTYRKWYIIYDSLHRHWRITLSKFLDFAVENKPVPNVERLLQEIISNQSKQDKKLDVIQIDTTAAVINSAKARKAAEWTKQELERKKKNAKKTGRKNQRNGEKNGNGRKTDARLKNQIMTEVRQTMRKNNCTQSNACEIVANKHLKAIEKTPIFSKRTFENWMSAANTKKTKSP